jgi:uncharacterized protein
MTDTPFRSRRLRLVLLTAAGLAAAVSMATTSLGQPAPLTAARAQANDPLATVKALYAAFEKNDLAAIRQLVAPEATWTYYGPEGILPFVGTRTGPDGVLDFFARVEQSLAAPTPSQREMLVSGDTVIVPGWEESTVKSTGGHYKVANVHIFKVVGNRIVRFEEYIDSGTVADAFAPASASRGQAFYTTCAGCHGNQGEGNAGMHAPRLAGLPESYLITQLRHFRAGIRGKPEDFYGYQMVGRANALLGDRGVRDVARFIAGLQPPAPARAGPAPAGGEAAYETCAACHGTKAEGNSELGAPPLHQLGAQYLRTQLANFRKGLRGMDPKDETGAQMRAAIEQVPEAQDGAIADYIATLGAGPAPATKR